MISRQPDERGSVLITIMVITSISVLFITAFAGWTLSNIKAIRHTTNRELALLIAESGVEYYRWHLAHAPTDFYDGTGAANGSGYVHNYTDTDGTVLGTFTLNITAPPPGSTQVTIKSTGRVAAQASIRRVVEVTLAKPSFAKYAVVANDEMRFGEGTEVYGEIHSNRGIRFDGDVAHNLVSSAVSTYDDPDHDGSNEHGVHRHAGGVDPLPPTAVQPRSDVFMAGRSFPVSPVDFEGMSADFASMKTMAQANGRYHAASGYQGYRMVLKTNDTYDLYRITSLSSAPSGCDNATWSVNNQTFLANYAMPITGSGNGIIFLEDNVWVEGQVNGARITIAAARFPESSTTWRNITVNNDLRYTTYDGSDVVALLAQGNFNVGLNSEDDLRIDAAVIAQNGRAGRYFYDSSCGSNYLRDTLTLYGMIGTNVRYGFAYTGNSSGYTNRNLIYDQKLLLSAPPSFPLTSDQYEVMTWRELPQ